MIEHVELRRERPHAVAEQKHRLAARRLTRHLGHRRHVVDERCEAAAAEIPELVGVRRVLAVPAVIVGVDVVSGRDQHFRDGRIASCVLAHAVRDLHDATLRSLRRPMVDRDFTAVGCGGRQQLGIGGHGHSSVFCRFRALSHNRRPAANAVFQTAEDRDGGDAVERRAAEIVRQSEIHAGQLAFAGASQQLRVDLIGHAQARGADGVTETFQTAVDLARLRAVAVVAAGEDVGRRAALIGKPEILHRDKLGDGEAIVDLGQRELGAWVFDPRLGIGAPRRLPRVEDIGAVPGAVAHLPAVARGKLHRLDGHGIAAPEPARDVRGRDDRAGGAVGHAAAVVEAKRVGDHRRLENRLHVDRLAQMRARVLRRVLMALPAHMRHRALEVVAVEAMLGDVGAGQLGERAGRGAIGQP